MPLSPQKYDLIWVSKVIVWYQISLFFCCLVGKLKTL